jgi:hypothetical protein
MESIPKKCINQRWLSGKKARNLLTQRIYWHIVIDAKIGTVSKYT